MNENAADPRRLVDRDAGGRAADEGAPEALDPAPDAPGPAPDAPGPAPDLALMKQWALEQLPVPLTLCDRHSVRLSVNAAMTRVLGLPEDELLGLLLGRDPQGNRVPTLEGIDEAAQQALRTGEVVTFETHGQAPGDARPHAWMIWVYPVKDPLGRTQGVALAAADSTAQYRARLRLDLLNEAGERIGTTLDLSRTADELAQLATTRFADFVTVDLLDSVLGGEETADAPDEAQQSVLFRRVAHRSVLPGCPEAVIALGCPHTARTSEAIALALAGGRPVLDVVEDADRLGEPGEGPETRWWRADAGERLASVRAHGIHSILSVPLRARGVTLGVANFMRHRTPDLFDDEDQRLALELCGRAAMAVDNARRYTLERQTALALQRALLPERAPFQSAVAVDVASRYLPADPAIGIGGDWFDVIPLSGTRVALVVGDVVGHGIQASATMGRLATAVRTLADADVAPDELLTQLDDLVLRLDEQAGEDELSGARTDLPELGATCLYAVYDPVSRRCAMARAGHPPPVLVAPDGSARYLEAPVGPPLGVGGLPFEVADFEIPEGSALAFYTDGLTEGAERAPEDDLAVFRRAAAPLRPLEDACEDVLAGLLPARRTDDAALLLVRTKGLADDRVADWALVPDPSAAAEARGLVADTLIAWGLQHLGFVTELVVTELVTNAIRYGHPPVRLRLIRDTTLICEVSDTSSTAPHLRRARTFDEGGRGLLIVAQLTRRWGSRQTSTGKTIWAEIPMSR